MNCSLIRTFYIISPFHILCMLWAKDSDDTHDVIILIETYAFSLAWIDSKYGFSISRTHTSRLIYLIHRSISGSWIIIHAKYSGSMRDFS